VALANSGGKGTPGTSSDIFGPVVVPEISQAEAKSWSLVFLRDKSVTVASTDLPVRTLFVHKKT
jgi:hypothetical protein